MTEATSRSPARYWKASDRTDVRPVDAIHDGVGTILVRSFFGRESRLGVHFHVWELPPGVTEGAHTHAADDPKDDYEELYYVLSGHGVAIFTDEEVPLAPGDALLVPTDVDHGLANRGDEPLRIVLVFGEPERRAARSD